MRSRLLLWACALVVILGLPTAAAAQDDPQVDPDSPAGKEYELPVDRAREDASPGDGKGASEAPLFGAGVEAPQKRAGSGDSKSQRSGSSSPGFSSNDGDSTTYAPLPDKSVSASAPASGGGQLLAIAGGAAGVLLLGGAAGLAWRRRMGKS